MNHIGSRRVNLVRIVGLEMCRLYHQAITVTSIEIRTNAKTWFVVHLSERGAPDLNSVSGRGSNWSIHRDRVKEATSTFRDWR